MGEKEGLDCKISKIAEEIKEIKEEAIWIRNKLLELFPVSYLYYAPAFRLMKGGDLTKTEFFKPEQLKSY